MPIDTSLLVASPTLQDYLVDKDTGFPLAAGIVTFYEDNQRNILKNWYYQSNNSPVYEYSAGPNPMTLTGVGTFSDANGNDVIPYFYPWNESIPGEQQFYYVVVENSNEELQFTREGFPPLPPGSSSGTGSNDLENYLINNEFWRNFGSATIVTPNTPTTINNTTYLYQTLAPSAHDGFSMPDIILLKDIAGATDVLTFQKFPSGMSTLMNDITPEYYLEWQCTSTQLGQMIKCIQFPLQLHILALEGQQATIVFHAKYNGTFGQIGVNIFQFCGTGSGNSSFPTTQTFVLSNTWTKYTTIPFTLPSAGGVPVSGAGDDALYVQFTVPPTSTFDILFAKPQLYLSNSIANNQYDTYDQIDAVINSPRTGDVRASLNSFYPFGWVPANNGSIGSASSNATTRANIDTWPLFNLIWNSFAQFSGTGASTSNPIAQMYNSSGSPVGYGPNISSPTTAYGDFNSNNAISLTQMLGLVMMGTVPLSAILANSYSRTFTASNDGSGNLLLTVSSTVSFFKGMPVYFTTTGTLAGGITTTSIYYISDIASGTTFYVSTSYNNALASTYIAYSSSGSGTQTIDVGPAGNFLGQFSHLQLTAEVGAHVHPTASGPGFYTNAGSPTLQSGTSFNAAAQATTGTNTPNSLAFNITQPSTFMNMYIKL